MDLGAVVLYIIMEQLHIHHITMNTPLKIFRHCCRVRAIILQCHLVHKRLAILPESLFNFRGRPIVPSTSRGSSFRKFRRMATEDVIAGRSPKLSIGFAVSSRAIRKCGLCRDLPAFKA